MKIKRTPRNVAFTRPPLFRSRSNGFATCAIAGMLIAAVQASAQAQMVSDPQGKYVRGRVLVMVRAGLSDAELAKIVGVHGGRARAIGRTGLFVVDLPSQASETAVVQQLARSPHLRFAELDRVVAPNLTSNDPYLASEWHIAKIGADTAWDTAKGDGVTIAILDTGVDGTHPDLSPRIVPGWNVYDNNSNTADVYGHGTKVAGTAAAALSNGVGVAGVAGNARIMPIRISAPDGTASLSAMAQGIAWAVDHGARVANISYVSADSATVLSAGSYMKSKGGLVTTSAGNYGIQENIAATTSVIPVSATDSSDVKASWSSYGAYVAIAAPGVGIYTTTNGGGYASVSGTSFSSPVIAGAIALIMSANPRLSSGEVESVLYATALDLGAAGRDYLYGYGRVNSLSAVLAGVSTATTTDTVAPTAAISSPLSLSTVSGLVPVDVSASDNVGVIKVELRANGTLFAADSITPYGFTWDSSKFANGMVNLVVTAYDAVGNVGSSSAVSVNVANATVVDTAPPTVVVTNPINGTTVKGNVAIKVTASDNSGVSGLRQTLYINGMSVASATGGSLSYSWNTRKAATGSYTIQAVAVDSAGNSAQQSIQVKK